MAVAEGAQRHLRQHAQLEAEVGAPSFHGTATMALQGITAVMGMGGNSGVAVLASFTPELALTLLRAELGAEPSEADAAHELSEIAAETLNVILGHSTTEVSQPDRIISLTPPFVIQDAASFRCPSAAMVVQIPVRTPSGNLTLNFVGPAQELLAQLPDRTA
jgi:CheY-specific phosphatase CheX